MKKHALWTKYDTAAVLFYMIAWSVAGLIVSLMGGESFSWLFAVPFLLGYLAGRVSKRANWQ